MIKFPTHISNAKIKKFLNKFYILVDLFNINVFALMEVERDNPSVQKGFEEKGSNSDSMSFEKQINYNQLLFVDYKVISRCNETTMMNKIFELPN